MPTSFLLRAIAIGSLTVAAAGAVASPAAAKEKAKSAPSDLAAFDQAHASTVLRGVDLLKCKVPGGPRGEGHAVITFAPSGEVQTVALDRAPYARSPVESCIAGRYKTLKVKPFKGDAVTVGKTFRID